jgi:hypothetical protein
MEGGEAPSGVGAEEGEAPRGVADETRVGSHGRSGPSAAYATPPARARAGAYASLLAGWASGGVGARTASSAPPKTGAFSLGGYAGLRRGRDDAPRTAGGDGRDKKRRRVHDTNTATTPRPCLFWRQGACVKGDACGYVHGDSQVPCTQFATEAGCRFGDKCAFKHVPGSNPRRADKSSISKNFTKKKENAPNPFATHAENCGCETCRPSRYRPADHADSDGEEGEMRVVVEESPETRLEEDERENNRSGLGLPADADEKDEDAKRKVSARDAVLATCAVIASPAMRETWSAFADPEVRRAQRSGPAPAPYKRA